MNRRAHPVLPLLLVGIALLSATAVQAQLGIALSSSETQFLRYEPVEVTVTLRNYSGNTLAFSETGANRGYLYFLIESHNGKIVRQLKPGSNPADGLVLNAGETKSLSISLNSFFDLRATGSYTVKARVGHARLSSDYQSETLAFEVREGLTMICRNVGMPGGEGDEAIKTKKASLLLFQAGQESIYCLQVEDEKFVYGTIRLGRQISSSEPELDADATSDLHLLFQVTSRIYSYRVYSLTGGQVRLRQETFYLPGNGVPRLSRSPGYITVANGRPATEGVDYRFEGGQIRQEGR